MSATTTKTVAIKSVRVVRYEKAANPKGKAYRCVYVHNAELNHDHFATDLCSTKLGTLGDVLNKYGAGTTATILTAFANDQKYKTEGESFSYGEWVDDKGKAHPVIEFGKLRFGTGKALKLALAMQSPEWDRNYSWLTAPAEEYATAPTPEPEKATSPTPEKAPSRKRNKAAKAAPAPQTEAHIPSPKSSWPANPHTVGSAEWCAHEYNTLSANRQHPEFADRLATYVANNS